MTKASLRPVKPVSPERIVTTATDIIAERGMEGLTMRLLASHLACSVGTLTYHFKSKEELLQHVFTQCLESRTSVFRNHAAGENFVDRCMELYSQVLPLTAESDREWRIVLAYWSRALPATPYENSAVKPVFANAVNVSTEIWRAGKARGVVLEHSDPEIISAQLMALVTGLAFHMLHRPLSERPAMLEPIREFLERHVV